MGPGCPQPASIYAEQGRLRGCPVWSGTVSFGPGTSSQGALLGHPVMPTLHEEVPSVTVLADSALAHPDAPGTHTHPGPCAAGAVGWSCFGRAAVPGGQRLTRVRSRRPWIAPLRCRRQGKSLAENKAHPSGPFHSVPINPPSATRGGRRDGEQSLPCWKDREGRLGGQKCVWEGSRDRRGGEYIYEGGGGEKESRRASRGR